MSSTVSTTSAGRPSRPAGRGRRRRLTFDRVSFFAVFLGVPLVIFLVFVVSPFVQAIYYSLTDWGGFSATMNFIGIDNYVKLFQDDKQTERGDASRRRDDERAHHSCNGGAERHERIVGPAGLAAR